MSITDKNRSRLINLLKELFQLDQPELDFGLYRVMHAKSEQITNFLERDLLKEIEEAFGESDQQRAAEAKTKYEEAIDQAKKFGAPNPEETEGVKEAKNAYRNAKNSGNVENEIYDHLFRFFERYYDSGDFMSRRYYARESDSRAAPYSVPYDGREVYLHWANKDQYYIKSAEYLINYTFELNAAIRQEAQKTKGADLSSFAMMEEETELKVHFRIIDASETEHGNIKASSDQKRFFHIHKQNPILLENGELVIQFNYRPDAEKNGQDNKWQEKLLEQAEFVILNALKDGAYESGFLQGLQSPSPTDSKTKRTLLGKYLYQYSARNTMDYFIHKDLGGFMRRELDFYIKNEIMRLDDIDNADAPKVEQYLAQIRVLRRIAQQLIAFLAQLEDFQKKLWLKKKFVTETNYCITLDRVPEEFYAEIAVNDMQREEWVKLFAIDEIKDDLVTSYYSYPLTVDFLKSNPYLLVDTALFSSEFKNRLIAEIPNLDAQCDAVLIHSDNFQALELMQSKYRKKIDSIYIDPPYNAKTSEILYRNSYKHSSWLSLLNDRLQSSKKMMSEISSVVIAIDENEQERLGLTLEEIFPSFRKHCITLVHNKKGIQGSDFSYCNEFAYFLFSADHKGSNDKKILESDWDWANLRKWGSESTRDTAANCFYPITIKEQNFINFGNVCDDDFHPGKSNIVNQDGTVTIYPIDQSGVERKWRYEYRTVASISHLLKIVKNKEGEYQIHKAKDKQQFKTLWDDNKYIAGDFGTKIITEMGINPKNNLFPKSIYSVYDAIYAVTKCNNTILDYFSGSGTTGHAVINLNREDKGNRKFILVEQNNYFDTVLKPRIQKAVYSKDWKDGKPISREGISHCFKTLRLESYEDTLNNLALKIDINRDIALANNPELQRDYLLNYFIDVETRASQSLLNIADFLDPTAYMMNIKKPGSEEQILQTIDLIETFNWLIGLWVSNIAAPHSFSAEFEREQDPDLPNDQKTRLTCKRLKVDDKGDYWFRLIEGYTLKVPEDETSKVATLIIWRKQTADAEKDNVILQKFLMDKLGISPRAQTYDVIYINGSHTLPNPVIEGKKTKVRLIEEAFHNAMWSGE